MGPSLVSAPARWQQTKGRDAARDSATEVPADADTAPLATLKGRTISQSQITSPKRTGGPNPRRSGMEPNAGTGLDR